MRGEVRSLPIEVFILRLGGEMTICDARLLGVDRCDGENIYAAVTVVPIVRSF